MTKAELIEKGRDLSDLRFMRGFAYDRSFDDIVSQGRAASEFAAALRDCGDSQAAAEARQAEIARMYEWHAFYNERARRWLVENPLPWLTAGRTV